jgi:hypothetical protein
VSGRLARGGAAGVAALCLCLAWPLSALARSVVYFGPINQPGNTESPAVVFRVGTNENKKPVELVRFSVYEPAALSCTPSGVYFPHVKFPKEDLPIPMTKRRFSARAVDYEGDFFEISGVVPRKGPARGTVQLTATIHFDQSDDLYCDTGVLAWEATVYKKPD